MSRSSLVPATKSRGLGGGTSGAGGDFVAGYLDSVWVIVGGHRGGDLIRRPAIAGRLWLEFTIRELNQYNIISKECGPDPRLRRGGAGARFTSKVID